MVARADLPSEESAVSVLVDESADRVETDPGDSEVRSAIPLIAIAMFVVTAVVVFFGFDVKTPGGLAAVDGVAFALALVWSFTGVDVTRGQRRAPEWSLTGQLLVGLDALVAATALSASRLAVSLNTTHQAGRTIATIAGPLVAAISLHLLLAFPDGRLAKRPRQTLVVVAYVAALAVGVVFAIDHRAFSLGDAVLSWTAAGLVSLPGLQSRYVASTGRSRDRLQWLGIGSVLAADFALIVAVLHALVGWPSSLGAVSAGGAVLIPLGILAGVNPRLGPLSGRAFVHVLSIVGFTVVVSAIYLIIVLGLGHAPTHSADRGVLGLSMLAAGIAAVGYVPARERLSGSATRFVYGAREAPDEVLRTFGSRLTRAIPMEELLLQLAESLRKTMSLASAEIYTGIGDVIERQVSVPDLGERSLVVAGNARPVITRAGVSGNAWASVWLPALVEPREHIQLRIAPISHGGELLGLIVVKRPMTGDSFSEDDDRVLADLARQVGLGLHNSQLDAALQTTLDELRKQANELRASRARVVASGDAERRRVERNLHDGAQQHLVALAVNLRLTRDIILEDPAAGVEMLDQLAEEVKETIQELRELAHGIYPPLLVDSGLVEALKAAANRSPLDVHLVTDGIGRYSTEVEAAIYFCCLEALQNAAKHAPSASVEVHLSQESGGLLFSVTDDGPGFDVARATRGHGFTNMADRLGAIGGAVQWESEPGHGSTIRGSVPLV
jgi:signal transduction histidine kinase